MPQDAGEHSRIQRDWMIYVTAENRVTNNYANLRRKIKCYASGVKPVCNY